MIEEGAHINIVKTWKTWKTERTSVKPTAHHTSKLKSQGTVNNSPKSYKKKGRRIPLPQPKLFQTKPKHECRRVDPSMD